MDEWKYSYELKFDLYHYVGNSQLPMGIDNPAVGSAYREHTGANAVI
jgi:hypothetical protein